MSYSGDFDDWVDSWDAYATTEFKDAAVAEFQQRLAGVTTVTEATLVEYESAPPTTIASGQIEVVLTVQLSILREGDPPDSAVELTLIVSVLNTGNGWKVYSADDPEANQTGSSTTTAGSIPTTTAGSVSG
jgi:hypothetical protein